MKRRAPVARQNIQSPLRASSPPYPFTAIVGQEEMKLALLLNVIDPSIGGVLVMGHRGTGKSTAVRALADLLPQIERVRDCLYGCDPSDEANLCDACFACLSKGEKLARVRAPVRVVDLPLGATEDRVCGTINIERALQEGIKAFEPGLLARANRGFLYIDEVNLLEDHLIDLLLDVSVTGRNVVEREGVSIEHPARFVLVGSGNPEEGELRPQLLDRFGLHVEVRTATELMERVLIVERREAFERDPERFRAQCASDQESLRRKLARARRNLRQVQLSRELLHHIAELCGQLQIDGHRGELTIARAARALAAFEGRKSVTIKDVRRVAALALRHRLRRDPLEPTGSSVRIEQQLDQLLPLAGDAESRGRAESAGDDDEPHPQPPRGGRGGNGAGGRAPADKGGEGSVRDEAPRDAPPALDAQLPKLSPDTIRRTKRIEAAQSRLARQRSNTRQRSINQRSGRYVRSVATRKEGAKIALDATLRAAAGAENGGWRPEAEKETELPTTTAYLQSPIPQDALRYKRLKRRTGTLFIFAIDTSGSMALNRIAQAKGALLRLLQQSYVKRDRVAIISFRGQGADVMLRPSGSATRARRILDALSIGGTTPLAAGLLSALELARLARRQSAERIVLLLFTDGRANVSLEKNVSASDAARHSRIERELEVIGARLQRASVVTFVVDTRNRFTSGGEGQRLASMIDGRYVYLPSAPSTHEQFTSLLRQARQPPG
jgi:magnesium chelatase subunit D